MPFRCFLILGLLSAPGLLGLYAFAQNDQPEMTTAESPATFKSKVNLVLVPVVVHDSSGHAIGNLRKEDFSLFDKGKPQVISRFAVEKSGAVVAAGNQVSASRTAIDEPDGTTATAAIVPRRFTAYVFDDLNVSTEDLMRVQKAAVNHLATLQPSDRAAIFTTSGRANLDFTDDKAKLRDAVLRIRPVQMFRAKSDCPDLTYYMADQIVNKNDKQALMTAAYDTVVCANLDPQHQLPVAIQMVKEAAPPLIDIGEQGARVTLSAIRDVVRRLSAMPGQRTVILVSPGFLTLDPESLEETTELLDRSARSNVMISALDARGLYTPSEYDAGNRGARTPQMFALKSQYDRATDMQQAGVLEELTDGTGGTFFHNSNDLEAGLNRIAAAPEYVYVLGFSPQSMKPDGTFHNLKVSVQPGKGLSLQARRGYFAPKKAVSDEDNAKAEIEEAVYSRDEIHDLPVDLHTQFFKPDPADAKLTVLARVHLQHMHFKKQAGRNNNLLTVVSVLFDRDGNYVSGNKKVIDMKLRDTTLARLNSGITVRSSFDVKPGTYLVRLVVRDGEGQLMSAENGAVDIP